VDKRFQNCRWSMITIPFPYPSNVHHWFHTS
jgi:hypothetical protein